MDNRSSSYKDTSMLCLQQVNPPSNFSFEMPHSAIMHALPFGHERTFVCFGCSCLWCFSGPVAFRKLHVCDHKKWASFSPEGCPRAEKQRTERIASSAICRLSYKHEAILYVTRGQYNFTYLGHKGQIT